MRLFGKSISFAAGALVMLAAVGVFQWSQAKTFSEHVSQLLQVNCTAHVYEDRLEAQGLMEAPKRMPFDYLHADAGLIVELNSNTDGTRSCVLDDVINVKAEAEWASAFAVMKETWPAILRDWNGKDVTVLDLTHVGVCDPQYVIRPYEAEGYYLTACTGRFDPKSTHVKVGYSRFTNTLKRGGTDA